ncbi:hypothetical protein AALO_G00174520 [Alosa alosa]|uniref:Uncharacterized protein n=1 Tax=Alosa alosa TaxID=278164 RepID=A0AAV6GBT7_9TELE|nr:hypothetical protein AALO_G00174520 [Alosa alosa]
MKTVTKVRSHSSLHIKILAQTCTCTLTKISLIAVLSFLSFVLRRKEPEMSSLLFGPQTRKRRSLSTDRTLWPLPVKYSLHWTLAT